AHRYGHPLSVVVVCIDRFDRIRESQGMDLADEIFREVCLATRGKLREMDLVARLGSEALGLVLPFTDQDGALFVAERIRRSLAGAGARPELGELITASIGVAEAQVTDNTGLQLLDRAVTSALKAQKDGGNRIQRPKEDVAPRIFEVRQVRASAQETYLGMVEMLCSVLEEKDRYPQVPASELADLAFELGRQLELPQHEISSLQLAVRFCDVGKIGVPETILLKAQPYTAADWRVMRTHCRLGFQILKTGNLHQVANIVLHHHERWDGTGYPSGLPAEKIPRAARIVSVLNAYRSMMSDRPWRPALGLGRTLQALHDGAGVIWDPEVVEAIAENLSRR
ncbi:MAG: diguanylate cyclase, partial [Cyanobacteria bacterium REEB65]|nr:diguanylate cyclase [Cyanobacteria bacterium REEB65]